MRILLTTSLKPELVKVWVCQESSPAGSLLPPVDLASIAAASREAGAEVEIADLRLHPDPKAFFLKTVDEFKPDAVLLNLTTTSAVTDYELFSFVPAGIKKICFGTHAQSVRKECFEKGIDFVLVGDPEAGLTQLIKSGFGAAPSLGVASPGNVEAQPSNWENLDTMPFPALDLLDLDRYHAPYIRRGSRFTILLSSRGCPYKCTYCLYPVLFGSKGRFRGPKNVVDEMQHDHEKFGVRDFYFLDATFNLTAQKVEDFCRELIERKLPVAWICNMRVAPVSEQMLDLMKRAGCSWIFYGVEDQDFLKETKKGTTKNATIEAFRKTKAAGIRTMAFTMLFPRDGMGEKEYADTLLRTLKALDADAFQCNVATPFPGTEIFDEYAKRGELSRDWSLFDPHGEKLPYEHKLDLVNIKRDVYLKFLIRNPLKVFKVAAGMDPKAFVRQARRFLEENVLARRR